MLLLSLLSILPSCLIWHWMEQASIQVEVQHSVNNSESLQCLGSWLSKKRACPCYLNLKQGLHQLLVAGYKMRCGLTSIWASVLQMLAPCLLWFTMCLGQWRGTGGGPGCAWEVPSLGQDAHINLKSPKRVVSELPAKEWCLLIWRAAAGHRHANTHTHTDTHTPRHPHGAYTCLYLSALGRWLSGLGSPHSAPQSS